MEVASVAFDHPDARRLLDAYFAELDELFGSFVAPDADELAFDARRGAVLVGYDEGASAVACGSLRGLDDDTAELKRMVVAQHARGRGFGAALLAALESEARSRGFRVVRLDTAAPLEEAVRLYLRAGYRRIERYNDNPYAAHWFEKVLR